jgi:hypothetical protein
LRYERRERRALPSGTRGRDAFRLRLFRGVGRAIDGVLTFHFLGGERVADLFRESAAQRARLGAFFELPDRTVRPHFVRHIGVGPFGIGFAPIDLGPDETALLAGELAGDRDPAPLGNLQREAALLALGLPSPGLALEGALDRRAEIRDGHAGVLAGSERRGAQLGDAGPHRRR